MNRSSLAAAAGLASLLAACGGGAHSAAPAVPATSQGTQSGTMSLTFGAQSATSAAVRKPQFVSSNATQALVSVNSGAAQTFDVSATSSLCQTASSVRTCAIPLTVPVGQVSIGVSLMAPVSGTPVMVGQGSNSVTVVSGTNFSVTVGISPVVAGTNSIMFGGNPTLSLTYGTAATVTGTVVFADPANTPITGSGTVPNFLTPVTLTSSDPHVTISPASLTTPGQTFTVTYDGSATVASSVSLTVKAGTNTIASATTVIPGLVVTRYNLTAGIAPTTIFPSQIIVGPDGNIWWTERYSGTSGVGPGKIGTINPSTGVITHYPTGLTGFATGIAAGGDGKIWYSNSGQLIARMNTDGTAPSSGPTAAAPLSVGAPGSQVGRLATDSQGNVWYLNGGTGFSQVAYVDATNFSVHTFGSTPTANAILAFGGLALGADNAMWFTEENFPSIQQIGRITTPANGVAGTYSEYPSPNSGALIYPTDITKGSDGKMWYSEFDSAATNQFYANFTPGTTISITEYPHLINPSVFANLVTIFNGTDGNIWLAEGGGAVKINPLTPSSPITQFFTDNGQSSMIDCISGTTPDGNLWCTSYGSGPNPGFTPTTDAILKWAPR